MHILIIPSDHFITEKKPLESIFQYEQAKALAKAGNNVGVISIGFITLRYFFNYPYKKFEQRSNINVYRKYKRLFFIYRLCPFSYLKFRYLNIFIKELRNYIKKHGKPDVIHAHNFLYAGFLALYAKTKFGIPFILTEHSTAFARGLIPNKLNSVLKSICNDAGLITCVSSPFKGLLDERLNINSSVLHNIVDHIFFEKKLIENKSKNFTFINVALMDEKKNQRMLIKAFSNKFKGQAVTLKIVGSGPLKTELKQLAEKLKVSNQVEFLGLLPRSSVRDELLKSNCFVLSSNYETFGVVLIEALASGLPLIATRCGGPEDIVNMNNGILVDVNNQEQLENAMQIILQKISSFDKQKLREEAKQRFGENAFVNNVINFYKSVL